MTDAPLRVEVTYADPYDDLLRRHWSMRIVARIGGFCAIIGLMAVAAVLSLVVGAIAVGILGAIGGAVLAAVGLG